MNSHGGVTFSRLPPPLQFQSAVVGPFLFGLVGGFLLGESEAGYWIVQAVGAALAVLGGMEHSGAAAGARRVHRLLTQPTPEPAAPLTGAPALT